MKTPEPLIVSWRGGPLRVRHDDPRLGPYASIGATVRSAVELTTDVEGLPCRLPLAKILSRASSAMAARYPDDVRLS